jgi:sterol desaturase/sphingolipid hydroxylase (fatty acid hydroxylase superfamily)
MTMTLQEFLRSVALAAAVMALISVVEVVIPLYARGSAARGRASTNLSLTVLVFTLNWVLMTAVAAIASISPAGGVSAMTLSGLPRWGQILVSVVILDFFTYVAHWAMHKLPVLWRFHRVHHSDPFVDATTSFRFHPLEGLWRFLWILVPAVAFGLPAPAVVIYRLISLVNGLFEHANVSVPGKLDRGISWIWVTPNMHKIHHSSSPEQTDSNYGNILTVFDRLFRTFTPTEPAFALEYGLGDTDAKRVKSLRALLRMPFEGALGGSGARIEERA